MPTINLHGKGGKPPPGGGKGPDWPGYSGSDSRNIDMAARAEQNLREMSGYYERQAKQLQQAQLKEQQDNIRAQKTADQTRIREQQRIDKERITAERKASQEQLKRENDKRRLESQGEYRLRQEAQDRLKAQIRDRQKKEDEINRLTIQGEARLEKEAMDARRAAERAKYQEERKAAQLAKERTRANERVWRDLGIGLVVGGVKSVGAGDIGGLASTIGGGAAGLAAGLGGAGTVSAGIISEIVASAVKLAANPVSAAYGNVKPYFDFQDRVYGLSRATGGSVQDSQRAEYALSSKNFIIPQWMHDLGSSPQETIASIYGTGIALRGDTSDLGKAIRLGELSPGMYGIPQMQRQMIGQQIGMGFGQANLSGVQGATDFNRTLNEAVSRGYDNSRVAQAMMGSLEIIASTGGAGGSPKGIADFVAQLMRTGTPGGVTGATAAQAAQGGAANFANILSNPMATASLGMQFSTWDNFKTDKGIASFIGEDNFSRIMGDPNQTEARAVIAAAKRASNPWIAFSALSSYFVQGDVGRQNALGQQAAARLFPNDKLLQTMAAGKISGQGFAAQAKNLPGAIGPSPFERALAQFGGPPGDMSSLKDEAYKPKFGDANYRRALMNNAGMSPALADALIKMGKDTGMDPLMLFGMGKISKKGKSATELFKNVGTGKFEDITQATSTINRIISQAGGGLGVPQNVSNVPKDAYLTHANAAAGDLQNAAVAAHTLIPALNALAASLNKAASTLAGANTPADVMKKTMLTPPSFAY